MSSADNSESKASSTVIKKASKICSTDNSEQKSSQTVLITRSQKKAEGYRDEIEDNFSDEDSNFEDNLTKEDTQKVSEKDDVDDLLEYFSTQEENKTQEDNSAINQIKQLTKPKRGRASKKEPKQKPPPKKKVGRKRKIEYPLEDPELGMQQFEDYDDLL